MTSKEFHKKAQAYRADLPIEKLDPAKELVLAWTEQLPYCAIWDEMKLAADITGFAMAYHEYMKTKEK